MLQAPRDGELGPTDSAPYKVDLTDPTVTCPMAPTFTLGSNGNVVTVAVSDTTSPPASLTATGNADTSTVGSRTVPITGYDNAGRSKTESCGYNVVFSWTGFFQPIDNALDQSGSAPAATAAGWNSAKAGSAIPVKFSLNCNQGLTIFAATPTAKETACPNSLTPDSLEELATGTTSGLKYDATADQYNYTWKTASGYAGTCQRLTVKLTRRNVAPRLLQVHESPHRRVGEASSPGINGS